MTAISDTDLLAVWESARDLHPALRPAGILRIACGQPAADRLPIGARDRQLLALRERWFGSSCASVADCPSCGEQIELTFDTCALSERPAPREIGIGYRLPDSRDLLAIAGCRDPIEARKRLAARCLTDGNGELTDEAIAALSETLSMSDPDGDITLAVNCPGCGASSDVLFDPASYFWNELDAAARNALREVDALAAEYGWSENDILSMPRGRRQIYLGMVTS